MHSVPTQGTGVTQNLFVLLDVQRRFVHGNNYMVTGSDQPNYQPQENKYIVCMQSFRKFQCVFEGMYMCTYCYLLGECRTLRDEYEQAAGILAIEERLWLLCVSEVTLVLGSWR